MILGFKGFVVLTAYGTTDRVLVPINKLFVVENEGNAYMMVLDQPNTTPDRINESFDDVVEAVKYWS